MCRNGVAVNVMRCVICINSVFPSSAAQKKRLLRLQTLFIEMLDSRKYRIKIELNESMFLGHYFFIRLWKMRV